ncbi:hypothetical protein [Hydrogenophaga sp.]|uniref:hypothetical protein n=1 Tax=Hydrogenophaga sp. TaxID=1904254 RepID=UPI003AF7B28A
MSPTPRIWTPERRAQDTWDWVSAEDVIRHALAAYTLARKHVHQPPGRRFSEPDGTSWTTREAFADNLALLFDMRLKTEGYQLGVNEAWATDARCLQKWMAPRTWSPDELLPPGSGSAIVQGGA